VAYCEACGHLNSGGARFCRSCGALQDVKVDGQSQDNTAAQQPAGGPEEAAVPLAGRLVVTTSSSKDAKSDDHPSTVAEGSSRESTNPAYRVPTVTDKTTDTPTPRGKRKKVLLGVIALVIVICGIWVGGWNRGKDRQLADGTKVFGARKLKDGTKKAERIEFPDGRKRFDATVLPDGTEKDGRNEFPNGQQDFDVTVLPDGTEKVARVELPNGEKKFDFTGLPDGSYKVARDEFPNGEKRFDVTLRSGDAEKIGRLEWPDGTKQFNVDVGGADYFYGMGSYLQATGNLSGAKEAFEAVLAKFPASDVVDKAKQRLADVETAIASQEQAKLAEEQENGTPIAYVDFYAKSHTGLEVGKRYRFRAAIDQMLCLSDTPDDLTHINCGTEAAFDSDAEYEAFLRGPERVMGTIVASMSSGAGRIQIHKVGQ
jgi:hypothetical protein